MHIFNKGKPLKIIANKKDQDKIQFFLSIFAAYYYTFAFKILSVSMALILTQLQTVVKMGFFRVLLHEIFFN